MKSSPLNNSEPPTAMSEFNTRKNACIGHNSNAAAIAVHTHDGISYLLPYAQFLYAERTANPALEKAPEASPEKLSIHFGCAEVIVLGSGLNRLEDWLQRYELGCVRPADSRLAAVYDTLISAVAVTLTKEGHEH